MQVIKDSIDYTAIEQELCELHLVDETDALICTEYQQIQSSFQNLFPSLVVDEDFELPDWHNHIRMLWVYLYSDEFYTPELIPRVHMILARMKRPWFAQFECFSPELESSENKPGLVGDFLLFRESVVFSASEGWKQIQPKLGV